MSTDSIIGIRDLDGIIEYVTCHHGGGRDMAHLLVDHYGSVDLAEGLVRLGDLSSVGHLGTNAPESHSWHDPVEGYTVAYHRDAGERLRVRRTTDPEVLLSNDSVRWVYLFDCDEDRWLYARIGDFQLHEVE